MKTKLKAKLKLNIGLAEQYSEFSEAQTDNHNDLADSHMLDVSTLKHKTKSAEFDFPPGAFCFNDEILANRGDVDIAKITESLYISNAATGSNPLVLAEHGITHVVNLVAHKNKKLGFKDSESANEESWMTAATRWSSPAEEKGKKFLYLPNIP